MKRRKKNSGTPKGKRKLPAGLISLLVTVVVGAIYFYVMLPALNFQALDFYVFLAMLCVVYLLSHAILSVGQGGGSKDDYEEYREPLFVAQGLGRYRFNPKGFQQRFFHPRASKSGWKRIPALLLGLIVAVVVIGIVISLPIFHAKSYYSLLDVQNGDFATDVSEVSYKKIPMLDRDSAVQLGRRALGEISTNSNLVSQFEVSDEYAQINYQEQPVRVSPLEYGNLIKWFNNRDEGIPAYVVVNMVTQEAQLVQLDEGMKYMTCEHFGRNLYRYLRFNYPTYLFGDVNFEIDDDGNPWWICSREVRTIGLFGGVDVKGAVMVNAVTGEHQYYEEVPNWVDRVYSADLLVEQYNYRGKFVSGWINSWLGQKGVTMTTDGYNYIAMHDDVYMYTGVTSAGSDESNVGFILVNQRTKEASYYNVTGAEEYSAMSSAEGAVQHLNYRSTFPILLNISDQPTYFMALKDSAQLVKMYAMVNVSDYQITATGNTVAACQSAYEQMLMDNGITVNTPVEEDLAETKTVSGRLAEMRSAVMDGNTVYYLTLEGNTKTWYTISAATAPNVVILNVGDQVTITYEVPEAGAESAILTAKDVQ